MCIAIVQKAGKRIPNDRLVNSFLNNEDGAGFAYIKDGKVEVAKGFMTMKSFLPAYADLYEKYGKDNPMLIHCRIATAGTVTPDNCHPFKIKGGALIHNGHLWSADGGLDAKKSDTREFAETFYNILDFDSVMAAINSSEFEEAIGYDRMAMLYDDGRFLTAGSWYEEDEALYSNAGFRNSMSAAACSYPGWDDWNYITTH